MRWNLDEVKRQMMIQGLTQTQLAKKAGIDRAALSYILRRGSSRNQTVVRIAKALGIDPATMIVENGREGREKK